MNNDPNDVFESLGGSLLNDLLADLNAAVSSSSSSDNHNKGVGIVGGASASASAQQQQLSNTFSIDDSPDDLFALLEQELISTYADPTPSSPSKSKSSLGLLLSGGDMASAGAMVVNSTAGGVGAADTEEDVWSNSLSQFGNMSLAADFLAADTASKQQQQQQQKQQQGVKKQHVVNQLFDESLFDQQGGEYKLEEDVVYGSGDAAAFNALLGASRAKGPPTSETATAKAMNIMAPSSSATIIAETTNAPPPPQAPAPPAPPLLPPPPLQPAMMFPPPPPHMTGFVMPPPPGVPVVLPPQPPMMLNPMLVPPVMPIMGMIPPPHLQNRGTAAGSSSAGADPAVPFDSDDFPALGSTATATTDGRKNQEESKLTATAAIATPTTENNTILGTTTTIPSEAQIIFNNTNPHTPPISAHLIQSKLMPFRDTCFIVNIMMRTLKSLDAYNDDYYHWSVLNRATTSSSNNPHLPPMPGVMAAGATMQPTPLLKGMKETVKEQQDAFQLRVKARAKTFAEEQKSLGQLVKTNVKRPKALLDTPVLKKEEEAEVGATTGATAGIASDNKYEAGQQVSRINLWKARVTIDRGYTAFLSLMELRRLIQTQMRGDPRILQELMVDVKSNIDLLHSSLGVSVQVNAEGSKTIEVDKVRLSTTLSLPKGRILCARSIEEGIVPHPSACNLLPVALSAIFSESLPVDGEERLLHALTGLILTESPGVDPRILCRCLEVATSFASSENNTPTIDGIASNSSNSLTSSHMRMNLLHAVLSMGKHVCAGSSSNNDWMEREQLFRGMLNLS
ncbi:hypothetical protein ACHAWU_007408 [Discostella pseudostelligera]|uniref:Uncharacterized protein n=1 Tax=Discostella pseudostelligera TaxID=259834 RepID=A0ABD3MBR7_9STRA